MIKFLPYLAKIQPSLPRGKKKVKVRTRRSRTTTDTPPSGLLLIANIANIILFEFCRCNVEILCLLAFVCTIRRYRSKGGYVLRAAVFPDFSPRLVLLPQRCQRLRSINTSTVDCQIFLLFRIFLAPTIDQSFDS